MKAPACKGWGFSFQVTAAGVKHMFSNEYEKKAVEFHKAFDIDIDKPLTVDLLRLRRDLLAEEMRELFVEMDAAIEALDKGQEIPRPVRLNFLKEAADVQYVLSGMVVTFGLPLSEIYDRVHESNMSKLGDDGKPVRRADGKVLKGPRYHPPVLDDLVD